MATSAPQELRHLKVSPNATYKKVSIVIPVYNERRTIETILDVVASAPTHGLAKEIILIDDKSTDGTGEFLKTLKTPGLKVILQEKNAGKGAALQAGFKAITGDIVIIQDADLEYDPHDYPALIQPFLTDKADIVYGSRYMQSNSRQVHRFWHTFFNKLMTYFSNALSNVHLSDMHTCYISFNRTVLQQVAIGMTSARFGFNPEFAARMAKHHYKVIEVPISYYPRTKAQGKKIGLKDGLESIWVTIKYNLFTK